MGSVKPRYTVHILPDDFHVFGPHKKVSKSHKLGSARDVKGSAIPLIPAAQRVTAVEQLHISWTGVNSHQNKPMYTWDR
jgi:hypothetical protein